MFWEVEYTDEFESWWEALDDPEQDSIAGRIDIMAKRFGDLMAKMSEKRREKIENRAHNLLLEMALQELRQSRNITQQELARELDLNKSALSKMENQKDMHINTLRRILDAMGGKLKLVAQFQDTEVVINQFDTNKKSG